MTTRPAHVDAWVDEMLKQRGNLLEWVTFAHQCPRCEAPAFAPCADAGGNDRTEPHLDRLDIAAGIARGE